MEADVKQLQLPLEFSDATENGIDVENSQQLRGVVISMARFLEEKEKKAKLDFCREICDSVEHLNKLVK